jgi:hypothetical protein
MTPLRRAALEEGAYGAQTLDALVSAIDVNDLIDLQAALPRAVTLDYPPERFIEGFRLSRQLWQLGFDRAGLIALAARLRRGETIDEAQRHWFKQVRARFKHLRFAFFLYSQRHRSPKMLSLVTLVMGELQDAVKVKGPAEVRQQASRLSFLLKAPTWRLLTREADRFVPSDAAGFRRFTLSEVASLQPLLSSPTIGAHAFHAGRKVISRQVSFHDDMRTLYPAEEHQTMARWLATLNGLMGQFHDDLVARNASGKFSYVRDTFALPDDIRGRLGELATLYLGTSSSVPSAS